MTFEAIVVAVVRRAAGVGDVAIVGGFGPEQVQLLVRLEPLTLYFNIESMLPAGYSILRHNGL